MEYFCLIANDLEKSTKKLNIFQNSFALNFRTKTRNVEQLSLQYLQGIFLEKGRGNMTNYAKTMPDTNNQSLQHFISDSP